MWGSACHELHTIPDFLFQFLRRKQKKPTRVAEHEVLVQRVIDHELPRTNVIEQQTRLFKIQIVCFFMWDIMEFFDATTAGL